MRVLLADPPAFTPPYDHELASALARAGARVELVTAPFRFGARPAADGYTLAESFYPRSSGIRRAGKRGQGRSSFRSVSWLSYRNTSGSLQMSWFQREHAADGALRHVLPC
jgi:hypothetical protein